MGYYSMFSKSRFSIRAIVNLGYFAVKFQIKSKETMHQPK